MDMCINIMHRYISLLYQLRGPSSNVFSVAVSTPNTQILVCKFHSPVKGTRAPRRDDQDIKYTQ